jgi:hypothetical protein
MSELSCQALAYIENAKTANTLRAYAADWQDIPTVRSTVTSPHAS